MHQVCGGQERSTVFFVPRKVVVGILLWGCLFFRETLAGAPGPETLPQPDTSRTAWMSPMKTPDGKFLAWRITKREEDSTVQELRGKLSAFHPYIFGRGTDEPVHSRTTSTVVGAARDDHTPRRLRSGNRQRVRSWRST